MSLWSVVLCIASLSGLVGLGACVIRSCRVQSSTWTKPLVITTVLVGALWSAFLMRPHEHVFQGLDASAYRLMARSFLAGRPACGTDDGLLRLPQPVREWVMLWPKSPERRTRDRSYEILSMKSGTTRPFFYPILPYCMVGFDMVMPFDASDYFVPVVCSIFSVVLIVVMAAQAGLCGVLLAVALLVGCPLPLWLFRGCFAESVSAAMLGMAALHALSASARSRYGDALACLLVGLSVSFHPVMILPSVFLMAFFVLTRWRDPCSVGFSILAFLTGILPIIVVSQTITSPYGHMNVKTFRSMLSGSGSISVLIGFVGCALVVVVIGALFMSLVWRSERIRKVLSFGRLLLPLLWALPCLLVIPYAGAGRMVRRGVAEAWSAAQWSFASAMAILLLAAIVPRRRTRERALLTAVFFMLPVFLYLKGAERMQLWSMRRLIVPLVLLLVALLPCAADILQWVRERTKRPSAVIACTGLIVCLCLVNPLRWPAPYLVRFDRGADAWINGVFRKAGPGLLVFDYHPYSVPFAVYEGWRVYGLSEYRWQSRDVGLAWFCAQAQSNDVMFVSAYANPGMEEGVVLREVAVESISLPRVRTKCALPAVENSREITLCLLKAVPATSVSGRLVLDKVFDGMRNTPIPSGFGVRGPWGRSDISLLAPDGARLPAQWTREGSAVVGPVPLAGEAVDVTVIAAACRPAGMGVQELLIQPPWDAPPLSLMVSNDYSVASGRIPAPAVAGPQGRTGAYRLRVRVPYAPSSAGIAGFNEDLGVLLHRITIATGSEPDVTR